MRRAAIMAAIILLPAGPAPAARLCRDTKGLFTPCIGERPRAERHRLGGPTAASAAQPRDDHDGAAPRRAESASGPSKPPLVARTRLCRDSKGLFTPCAR